MTIYIGITGLPACGKGTAKDFILKILSNHEYSTYYWSMSDDVRKEARNIYGDNFTRDKLTQVSRQIKEKFGPSALAERAIQAALMLPNIKTTKVIIFEAIKSSEEVRYFRKHLGKSFILLGIECPIHLLSSRIIKRNRSDEDPNILFNQNITGEIIAKELMPSTSQTDYDIQKCLDTADYLILNDGSFDDFYIRLNEFVESIVFSNP